MRRVAMRASMLWIGALLCGRLVCEGANSWTPLGPFDTGGDPISCQSLAVSPDGSTIYAGADSAVYRTDDGGQHWKRLAVPTPGGVFKLLFSGSSLFAATATGVFVSSDGAETWAEAGLAGLNVFALAVDPHDPGTLYAGTWVLDAPGLVFKSTDRSATWDPIDSLEGDWVISMAVDPLDSATLFAGSQYGRILSSADAGSTWTATETGIGVVKASPSMAWSRTESSRARMSASRRVISRSWVPSWGVRIEGEPGSPVPQLPQCERGPSRHGPVLTTTLSTRRPARASSARSTAARIGERSRLRPAPWISRSSRARPRRSSRRGTRRRLASLAAPPGPCVPDATTLCLNDGRFRVTVGWQRTPEGPTGQAQANPVTSDSGYFWFLDADNVELMVKVLDGRPVNGAFWVFYGSLTSLGCTITVTDTMTGESKDYVKAPGNLSSEADTHAFPAPDAGSAGEVEAAMTAPAGPVPAPTDTCEPGSRTLCLNEGRFRVQVVWQSSPSGPLGIGQTIPLTDDTGAFWFLNPANIEVVVKVLDARPVNGHFWVFYGSLSNLDYLITVTDTETGETRTYHNPRGTLEGGADTSAF